MPEHLKSAESEVKGRGFERAILLFDDHDVDRTTKGSRVDLWEGGIRRFQDGVDERHEFSRLFRTCASSELGSSVPEPFLLSTLFLLSPS
eukprot:1517224-Rhodomonas_salina.4